MTPSILKKLDAMTTRHTRIAALMSDPSIIGDQTQYRELGREHARLEKIVAYYLEYTTCQNDLSATEKILEDNDAELKALAQQENEMLKQRLSELEKKIRRYLLPRDSHDHSNIYVEIRAGTGGDEAAIFAGDLLRMYSRYAENRHWRIEIINANEGEYGGYKEVISRILGEDAYSRLKFESGVHRVQRIPETESQGRIHTSAATVAVLPEAEEIDHVDTNPSDLRIDKFRASGAGGQHVNKTDSAIRITHLPSGLVAECQEERSQHRNKARAMALLKAKLLDLEQRKQDEQQARIRKDMVGSGDRSQRIRTYNFPQGRVTDHRINLTLHQLPAIIAGALDPLIEQLTSEYQAAALAQLDDG